MTPITCQFLFFIQKNLQMEQLSKLSKKQTKVMDR